MNKNQDSLREQIIESMRGYTLSYDARFIMADEMFDMAIMPVLERAMKAGELLLHRATEPVPQVSDAIVTWLEGCLKVIATIHRTKDVTAQEHMAVLAQLEDGATRALADARALRPKETTRGRLGKFLAGKPLPMRG